MLPRSLKTIFARVADAWDARDRGIGYVLSGGSPTAFGAASLRVDLTEAFYVDSLGAPQRQVATNVTPGPSSATLTRADLVYLAQGGGVGLAVGVGVIPSATVPVIPPAIPANGTPIAILYIGPGAVDYSDPTKAYIHDLRPFSTGPSMPNLIPNGDFSRRTVKPGDAGSLAMPEVLADANGYLITAGAPTVAANILTQNAANNEVLWPKSGPGNFWRDGRFSATFKAVVAADTYAIRVRYASPVNYIEIAQNQSAANQFEIRKVVGGVTTNNIAIAAITLTVNRWYWIECEMQGTTVIAKLYDTGVIVPSSPKSSSTLIATISATVADAGVAAGDFAIRSSSAATQWGGIAVSPGGVYVEMTMPESWPFAFSGTLGGQAISYDEAADSGPIGKQFALRGYIPHISRSITAGNVGPNGGVSPLTPYTLSAYMKVSGYAGSGPLVELDYRHRDSSTGLLAAGGIFDGLSATWARKTLVTPTGATIVRTDAFLSFNPSFTASGTGYIMCAQNEQGPIATAWRPAPTDDGPFSIALIRAAATTLGTTPVEIESRDLGANVHFPWDAKVRITFIGYVQADAPGRAVNVQIRIDGSNVASGDVVAALANSDLPLIDFTEQSVTAGKHRISVWCWLSAGTGALNGANFASQLLITATRGK